MKLVDKAEGLPLPAACTYWNLAEQALFREVNVAPIVNRPEHNYLNKAQVTYAGYDRPIPTSIKLLR